MTTGHKQWNQTLKAQPFLTLAGHTFTVKEVFVFRMKAQNCIMLSFVPLFLSLSQEGLYRIVAKVNGTSSSANVDHLALYVNNQQVSRSMVGLDTGYQIASHINEVVAFKAGSTFSVCSSYHIFSFFVFLLCLLCARFTSSSTATTSLMRTTTSCTWSKSKPSTKSSTWELILDMQHTLVPAGALSTQPQPKWQLGTNNGTKP